MGVNKLYLAAIGTLFEMGARIILGKPWGIIRASTPIIDRIMVHSDFLVSLEKFPRLTKMSSRCRGTLAPSH